VVVVVVVVVVLGVVLGGGGGGGLCGLLLVVLSSPEAASSEAADGLVFRRSTQHLICLDGHPISSLTSSHKREAKACKHLPGHSVTSAVLVMEPSNPEINPPHPACCGPCRFISSLFSSDFTICSEFSVMS